MILYPNAKINLGLRIVEKRSDGFHNIETLFLPIDLCDILEFLPLEKGETRIEITGVELDSPPGENLVVRAWQMMHQACGIPPVKIHLHKIIPVGAGLGGGSADAAFMLKGLNDFFDCNLSQEELSEMAAGIGSDCAFFIANIPAIGTGRGEILEPLSLQLREHEILLVNPGIPISSREAYAGVTPDRPESSLKEVVEAGITTWQESLINDFEPSVFRQYPAIGRLKEKMIEMGAGYAAMSGSGSSVYGLFPEGLLDTKDTDFGDWFTYRGKLRVQGFWGGA